MTLACTADTDPADAYGHLEADSYILSAKAQGEILSLQLEEGQQVEAGTTLGWIDTASLALQKAQVKAGLRSLQAKIAPIEAQLAVLEAQLNKVEKEQQRVERLVAKGAATPQQLDELTGQVTILQQQLKSTESQRIPIQAEFERQALQLDQLGLQQDHHRIVAPRTGTVLIQYAEAGEVIAPGRPIAEVASLDQLQLRAYLTADQLADIKLGQTAAITFAGQTEEVEGTIAWISDQAEFTPKTIQTREERAHLVYAIRLAVPNKGQLKIGMPVDLTFTPKP